MHPDASVLGTQLTMSAVIVFILQVLKKASWFPWLSDQTQRLNTIVAVVLSGLAALGIHSSFDPASHVLTITGLSRRALHTPQSTGFAAMRCSTDISNL